jgi:FkbM family methyltransferase
MNSINGQPDMKAAIKNAVILALGSKYAHPLTRRLAQIGLLGLGVGVGSEFETNGEEWLTRRLFEALPGAVCADVGANVGDYTHIAAQRGASRILAFEPAPSTFKTLSTKYASDRRVELFQTAVGEEVGETSFYVPIDHESTFASRDITITTISDSRSEKIDVPITTLDRVSREHNVVFDIIKIDVEGFELEVLKGAKNLLAEHPPQLIHFEFNTHHRKRRQTLDDFANLLPEYALFRLASRSLRPIELEHAFATIYSFQNIICIHESSRLLQELV